MLLPIWMLKALQMQSKQKYGLATLFSMAIIIVIFEIIRTAYTIRLYSEPRPEPTYRVSVYTLMEAELAVIISALISYRPLFSTQRKRNAVHRYLSQHKGSRAYSRVGGSSDTGKNHAPRSSVTSNEHSSSRESVSVNGIGQYDATSVERMV